MSKLRILSRADAIDRGYSTDKRKRRRQHRRAARALVDGGTFLNARAPRGSIPHAVAQWHLFQARHLGR